MNRRSFFKTATGVIITLFVPGKMIAKIPNEPETMVINKGGKLTFNWIADSDWGIITYVGVFDKYNTLMQLTPVDQPKAVSKADQITLTINLEGERSRVQYIGLFTEKGEEVSGNGYQRLKTWTLKLLKG